MVPDQVAQLAGDVKELITIAKSIQMWVIVFGTFYVIHKFFSN